MLARDVEARFALRGRRLRYTILAPIGAWLGVGALRVLRVRAVDAVEGETLDLVLGYERYDLAR